ncbi:MAG: dihydroorotate dehydrogenase electron transfer subunit, partial [Nitrososphaerota archaeon]
MELPTCKVQRPRVRRVEGVITETPTVKTILLDEEMLMAAPGQFLMVWIPGVDEVPMSISSRSPLGITFRKVGEATGALFKLRRGDLLGVRGPLGRGFELKGEKILVVGGGVGVAPLFPLVEDASRNSVETHVVIGAKTKEELVFVSKVAGLA